MFKHVLYCFASVGINFISYSQHTKEDIHAKDKAYEMVYSAYSAYVKCFQCIYKYKA